MPFEALYEEARRDRWVFLAIGFVGGTLFGMFAIPTIVAEIVRLMRDF